MRAVILWIGIAAFVWIGLHPPIIEGHPVETPSSGSRQGVEGPVALYSAIIRLVVVVVLTAGLLWTEAQVRPWLRTRLYPWLRTLLSE